MQTTMITALLAATLATAQTPATSSPRGITVTGTGAAAAEPAVIVVRGAFSRSGNAAMEALTAWRESRNVSTLSFSFF